MEGAEGSEAGEGGGGPRGGVEGGGRELPGEGNTNFPRDRN